MRPTGLYAHHASQPETVLAEQLKNLHSGSDTITGAAIGGAGTVGGQMNMKSSQSRGNLPLMPELEYDPWHTNQQRYLAHQNAAVNKQAFIY